MNCSKCGAFMDTGAVCPKCDITLSDDVVMSDAGDLFACKCATKYSIERHGKGWAIYWGRCNHKHGANIAHISECPREDIIRFFEKQLNK